MSTHYFTPINKTAQVADKNKGKVLSLEQIKSLKHFDWVWMAQNLDQWTERWNKTIKG
jgi:hypothetical protein